MAHGFAKLRSLVSLHACGTKRLNEIVSTQPRSWCHTCVAFFLLQTLTPFSIDVIHGVWKGDAIAYEGGSGGGGPSPAAAGGPEAGAHPGL